MAAGGLAIKIRENNERDQHDKIVSNNNNNNERDEHDKIVSFPLTLCCAATL